MEIDGVAIQYKAASLSFVDEPTSFKEQGLHTTT